MATGWQMPRGVGTEISSDAKGEHVLHYNGDDERMHEWGVPCSLCDVELRGREEAERQGAKLAKALREYWGL